MHVAGIDGTKTGWAVIELTNGRFAADRLLPLETDFAELAGAQVRADRLRAASRRRGRTRLSHGRRQHRLHHTKPRHTRTPFRAGLGVSAQAHALGPRVLHVTALAQTNPRLYEVHPEVSFRATNDGRPLRYRKKTAGGALERIKLLAAHGIHLDQFAELSIVPLDDVLDAAAAAWTAHRIATATAHSLPDPPQIIDGHPTAIWY